MFKVINAGSLCTIMSGRNEIIDSGFMFLEEGMDMILVQQPSTLCLRCNEVKEEARADPGIEGNPTDITSGQFCA